MPEKPVSIIFPVNNKGGVGKTSILTELIVALAHRHAVGIMDFDDQASLARTLTGEDFTCLDLGMHNYAVRDVKLMDGASFMLGDSLSDMALAVKPTHARLAVFPAGAIYDDPGKRRKLEEIIATKMPADFLALDLPPIPHPGMVLDYTVKPVIEAVGSVKLFPLIVATPDHNVIEIALRGYAKIEDYFMAQGISDLHPIFILNKVPIERRGEKVSIDFVEEVSAKLGSMGLLYLSPTWDRAQINHVNRHFDYDGRRFRSVLFPFMDVRDGRYSLLFGSTPILSQFPHLVDIAQSHGYAIPAERDVPKRVYMHALSQLSSHIVAFSESRPRKDYEKRRRFFDPVTLDNETVHELSEHLAAYYATGKQEQSERVRIPAGGSTAAIWYEIPRTRTPEEIARMLQKIQQEIRPEISTSVAEFSEQLRTTDSYGLAEEATVWDRDGLAVFGVTYYPPPYDRMKVAFPSTPIERLGGETAPVESYLPKLRIILKHLGAEIRRKA